MGEKRRKFSREFKLDAVRMVVEGGHVLSEVARDLDLRPERSVRRFLGVPTGPLR
jgi:transposase-like protein